MTKLPYDYEYKTEPFEHQRAIFERTREAHTHALLLEQGTGKTKIVIDTAAYLYASGLIDTLLVVAPNGVHNVWVESEIPEHMPEYIAYEYFAWNSKRSKSKSYMACFDDTIANGQVLSIFAFNVDAVITKKGFEALNRILTYRRCLFVIDESHTIKTPSAQRTKELIKLSKMAYYKRILTGTPVTQGPLDLYSQFEFLDESILGFTSYYAFRNRFAVLAEEINFRTKKKYVVVKGYKSIEELSKMIEPYSSRVVKKECLDLPDKLYQKRYVYLSDKQRSIYDSLRDTLIAELDGEQLSAPLVLTKMLRLQQIMGGHFPTEESIERIDKVCPRESALLELLEETSSKVIIWARFTAEIRALERLIRQIYKHHSVVTYFGETSSDERLRAIERFQNDDTCRFFIGQPKSGGTGITLHAASTVIYYSNDFSLATRLQSEDRAHRIGQHKNVTYIDLIARDTLDFKICKALRDKLDIASAITKDDIREWI
jgi:SNF2 family DNA or RNA helicase